MVWRAFDVGDFFVFISMKLRSIVFIFSLILIEVFYLIACKNYTEKFLVKIINFKSKEAISAKFKIALFKIVFCEKEINTGAKQN